MLSTAVVETSILVRLSAKVQASNVQQQEGFDRLSVSSILLYTSEINYLVY